MTTTLAEAVDAFPQLAREFERRGLDYCCGGRATFVDACSRAGLDPVATLVEFEEVTSRAGAQAPWTSMTADVLVDYIESTHHRYLWEELPRLTALSEKLVAAHATRHPVLNDIAASFAELRRDLEPHMLKEERVLFPMVRELATASEPPSFHCGTLQNPISVMIREHDAVGELLARMRQLTSGYQVPDDGCATYRACFAGFAELEADTHRHVHIENNVLFPTVLRLEQQWS